jgi:hypothetical protein
MTENERILGPPDLLRARSAGESNLQLLEAENEKAFPLGNQC